MSASQPLAAERSQSAKPAAHAPTPQVPLRHAALALGTAQADPQAPQCAVLAAVSTQAPPQQVCPPGHDCALEQPAAQTFPTQRKPAGQCASTTHATQRWALVSQRAASATPPSPPGVAQSPSRPHPGSQRPVTSSQ
ncbi:MAG: hypothetical protein U0325_22780 [Polyangiales bacterium]